MAVESAWGIPVELFGLVTPLPADGGPVPGEIAGHQAPAIGHAAVLLADRGVLLAGDMGSDVLIPLLDRAAPIRWAPTRRHSTGWVRPPGTPGSWSPATAPLPRVPRWLPASPLIMPTSTRCGEERTGRRALGIARVGAEQLVLLAGAAGAGLGTHTQPQLPRAGTCSSRSPCRSASS